MRTIKKKGIKMGFHDKITMSPFQKYYKYDRFPWKFLIHILLVIFTTYQAMSMVNLKTSHSRAQHQVFKYVLFQSDDESNDVSFYKLEDFQNNVQGLCDTMNTLDDQLLQYVDTAKAKFSMQIYYTEFNLKNSREASVTIPDISECIKTPFDISDATSTKNFLNEITKMEIISEGIQTYTQFSDSPDTESCLDWTINIAYDFQSYANIKATITTGSVLCQGNSTNSTFGYNYTFIHIVVAILALLSLILSTKYFYEVGKKYIKHKVTFQNVQKQLNFHQEEGNINQESFIRQTYQNPFMGITDEKKNEEAEEPGIEDLLKENKSWDDIGFFNKLKLFNLWFVVSIIGNIIQIIGCLIALLDTYIQSDFQIFQFKESIIGFGSMFAWIIMLNYLQYNKNVNLMTGTLQKSSSNIFMFLLGVLPFFFGFVFLGQCIFWKYTKFEDTPSTIITLFSLSNGDIVNETFMDTWSEGILGQLYLIVFMILFFTAVQNVFVTIIMEGYDDSKKEKNEGVEDQNEAESKQEQEEIQEGEEEESKKVEMGASKSDKEMVLNKLRINTQHIKKILDEMEEAYNKIETVKLKREDKDFLIRVYHDNLDNLNRNLKFQLTTMGR